MIMNETDMVAIGTVVPFLVIAILTYIECIKTQYICTPIDKCRNKSDKLVVTKFYEQLKGKKLCLHCYHNINFRTIQCCKCNKQVYIPDTCPQLWPNLI